MQRGPQPRSLRTNRSHEQPSLPLQLYVLLYYYLTLLGNHVKNVSCTTISSATANLSRTRAASLQLQGHSSAIGYMQEDYVVKDGDHAESLLNMHVGGCISAYSISSCFDAETMSMNRPHKARAPLCACAVNYDL